MFNQTKTKAFIFIACTLLMSTATLAKDIPPIDCMIEPNIMVDISSPVEGVLETLTVDRSDEVRKGQVIATLKSEVEQVGVKMSEERLKLSQVEYKRAIELYRRKAITLTEKDKSDNEKKLSELDLQHAEANLDLRKIKSPIDGVVVKRYSSPGEFVESEPILKLAQLNPLKIEVVSPVANYGKIVKGMRAKILPDFGDYQDLVAEVVVVDKVIDAASGTFGVRLELANEDLTIPSGLKCKVRFMPEKAQADNVNKTSNPPVTVKAKTTPENNVSTQDKTLQVASANDETLMCSSIGPYKKQKTLNELLDKLDSDIKQTALRSKTKIKTTYRVVSEVFKTPEQTMNKMLSMKKQGVKDIAMMNKDGEHRIALGLYRKQSFALERVKTLQKKGYKVQMKPVNKEINTYWADVAYLPQSTAALNNAIPESHRAACDESVKLSLLK